MAIAEELKFRDKNPVSWSGLPSELAKLGHTVRPSAIRAALRRSPRYPTRSVKGLIEYEDKKELPTPDAIGEYYDVLKCYNDAVDNLDTKQTKTCITINDDRPIGIAFWGDWHIGARGVNYRQFDIDRELINQTDGLYCIGLGDYKENQNALVHASGVNEQFATPGLQDILVRNFFYEVKDKMLAAVTGCHDSWDKKVGDKDFIATLCEVANCVNLWHGGGVTINLQDQTYKIRARHKYKNESGMNTTNAQRNLLNDFGPADVIAVAHKHFPDYQEIDRMGQAVSYLRTGTYKIYDEYGQQLAGYQGKVGVPVIVFYPGEHRFLGVKDLRNGIELLKSVRR